MFNRIMGVVAVLGLAACGDGIGPGQERTVSLSLTTGDFAPSLAVSAGDTLVANGHTLVLERVQMVLREIELDRADDSACDSIVGDDDACEKFETGPLLVDLPLGGEVASVLTVAIDTGTYDELEFELHKPEDDDSAFLAAHPDFARTTIRVSGTFDGTPFVYETDLDAEQEIDLVPPLVITEAGTAANLTLRVDVRGWFVVNGMLVNPATANKGGLHEGNVKENIKSSFEAFEDDDHDGDDDR